MNLKMILCAGAISFGGTAMAGASVEGAALVEFAADHDEKALSIMDAYVEKIGGRDVIMSIDSSHVTATMSIPSIGLEGTMDIKNAVPGKLLVTVDLPGMGQTLSGYDGEVAWSSDVMAGPRILPEDEAASMMEQANPHAQVEFRETYDEIGYEGEVDFRGTQAHKIKLVMGEYPANYQYFSIETGLLLGTESTQASPMGEVTVTTLMDEYKEFGGVLVPTKMTNMMGPQQFFINIQTVEANTVDDSVFDLPESIQALVAAQQEAP